MSIIQKIFLFGILFVQSYDGKVGRSTQCTYTWCQPIKCKYGLYTPPGSCCPICAPFNHCAHTRCEFTACKEGEKLYKPAHSCCPGCTPGCILNGKFYLEGQAYKDGCGVCTCRNSSLTCNNTACTDDVKPGTCPGVEKQKSKRCNSTCSADTDCPEKQKCCSSGCGSRCIDPPPAGYCMAGSELYKEGDHVPSSSHCKTCLCTKGLVVCRRKYCKTIACVGKSYTPEGACCPRCQF